jgi:signal transduction histidine kinase
MNKIQGDEPTLIVRWYIAIPPILLIGFLIGLFFLASAGQSRLNAANERVHASQLRQQSLIEFAALVSNAESAQRGYLLTGELSYLQPYADAVARIGPALDRLHEAYGRDGNGAMFQKLNLLTGKKLGELADSVALYKRRAPSSFAVNALSTDVGKGTMDEIVSILSGIQADEALELDRATAQWRSDFRFWRWVAAIGAIFNIALVVLATFLVLGDMRRRARQTLNLRDQKLELEKQVKARTEQLTALSTHLQGVSEQEKSALSRELHDELGGLLVAARMDLSWLQQRLPTTDPGISQRFKRIHESLSAGVDLKRRVVEELRPTLLDNMGLYSALRWQFKETCRRTGLKCTETIPDDELKFNADAAIGVFRVAQEALTNILKHAEATSADLSIDVGADFFELRIRDDGKGLPRARPEHSTSHGIASMRHRVAALGGTLEVTSAPSGVGTLVVARFPLHALLQESPIALLESDGDREITPRLPSTIVNS